MKTQFSLSDELMEKINSFARRELSKDEVYAFPVILCDNEIDRDNERFSVEALKTLSELFVGKTGIFDHNPKGENQTARIFDTEIMADNDRKTQSGEPYTALIGKAYMIRTSKNADLIAEIDGGIKKEVSISCSVAKKLCSVCGKDKTQQSCSHVRGRKYAGKLCHVILCEPLDAYEFSFVAIPAQRGAGVTKSMGDSGREFIFSDEEQKIRDALIAKAIKHGFLLQPVLPLTELKSLLTLCDTEKLREICDGLTRAEKYRRAATYSHEENLGNKIYKL